MTKKVLVVEDETLYRLMVKKTLEQHSIHCLSAEDGNQALAIFSENPCPCDLILTDLCMPGMDGVTLIKTVRKQEKESGDRPIPIVVLYAEKGEMVDAALQLGVNDYFIKSATLDTFIPRLQALLGV